MIFTTGTFGMGDSRYHERVKLPDNDPSKIPPVPWLDVDIVAIHEALATYSGAKLISVSKGIHFDDSDIPDADPEIEYRLKVLVRFADGKVDMLEIPMLEPTKAVTPSTLLTELVAAGYCSLDGEVPEQIIQVNRSPERRARGR